MEIIKNIDNFKGLKIRTMGKAFFKTIGYLKLPVLFIPVWMLYRENKKIYQKFIKVYEIIRLLDGSIKIPKAFLLKRFIPMILVYSTVVIVTVYLAPNIDLKKGEGSVMEHKSFTYYVSRFTPHIYGLLGIMQMVMLLGCVAKLMNQIEIILRSLKK